VDLKLGFVAETGKEALPDYFQSSSQIVEELQEAAVPNSKPFGLLMSDV
jgi:hypothetical protein